MDDQTINDDTVNDDTVSDDDLPVLAPGHHAMAQAAFSWSDLDS